MLYAGFLYRAIDIMDLIVEIDCSFEDFIKNFPQFNYIQSESLLSYCMECGWIYETDNQCLKPSHRGLEIRDTSNPIERLRLQIKDVLNIYSPPWLTITRRGRNEVKRNLSPNELQCFEDAKLFGSDELQVIRWWDELILSSFDELGKSNHSTGRKGELLTCYFEELRTGKRPTLHSLDVNTAGFDVLSIVSDINPIPFYIEVKASTRSWSNATFFLTRNEWGLISKKKNSGIHLWSIGDELNFANINYDDIKASIPIDIGLGKWKNVEIPFNVVSCIKIPFTEADYDSEQIKTILN